MTRGDTLLVWTILSVAGLESSSVSCDLPRINGATISRKEFDERWRGKIVVLQGLLTGWPAWRSWGKGGFSRRFGHFEISRDHVNKRVLGHADDRNVAFGNGSFTVAEALAKESQGRRKALWLVQPPHPLSEAARTDIIIPDVLKGVRHTGPFVSVGMVGQGGNFNNHPENWLAQVRGRKRWMLLPPKTSIPSFARHARPCELLKLSAQRSFGEVLRHCVIKEGEVIYLGDNWHHATCNVKGNGSLNLAAGFIGKLDHLPRALQAAADGDTVSLSSYHDSELLANVDGKSSLSWAASSGHLAAVQHLLNQRVEPSCDHGRAEPMHWAAGYGHMLVVERLLALAAASRHCPEAVTLRTRDSEGLVPVAWAAKFGHRPIVELLLRRSNAAGQRIDVVAVDAKGATPLHWAARYGHDSVINALISTAAVAVDAAGADGTQALHWAAKYGEVPALDQLLSHRANPDAASADGTRPLHLAARYGQAAAVSMLLGAGIAVDATDANGARPLDWAVRLDHVEVVRRLVNFRASLLQVPSRRGQAGPLALHWAASAGHVQVIDVLASAEITALHAKDKAGMRPLHYAASAGHAAAIEALLKHRADPAAAALSGAVPAALAASKGHNHALQLLRSSADTLGLGASRISEKNFGSKNQAEL
eukprot:TRINITY_DN74673_c0_g1_i1.p1 TRINITY_DN74673_c0_g1~~TRINITY_DN74673_c0_g1_i1.p1  ORF type:complete len:651 (+),score=101.57 TRINITY_DN74673_c0_g1_i1:91-2043(+)